MDSLISVFMDLLSIPSPSGKEDAMATYIREYLSHIGYEVEDERSGFLGCGNLLVRWPQRSARTIQKNEEAQERMEGAKPLGTLHDRVLQRTFRGTILLSAHMDTVPVPDWERIPVMVEGDVVHTGGACPLGADDKAGVALALYLLEQASLNPQAYRPFEVLFTVREEQGCAGARAFDTSRLSASWGICLDGETPVGSAVIEAPTKLKYTLDVRGKSAHAALEPEKGINAIKAAGALLGALPTGALDSFTTANIGMIEGGFSINVVPDRCLITGELRSRREGRLRYWKERIEEVVGSKVQEGNRDPEPAKTETVSSSSPVRLEESAHLTWELMYKGYSLYPNTPILQAFQRVCEQMGLEPQLLYSRGGGDANFFNAHGIPTFVLGLGMEEIHTPQERYRLTNLRKAAGLLEKLLKKDNS